MTPRNDHLKRYEDIWKAEDKNRHEPNKYLASIRRQLCSFKLQVLEKEIEQNSQQTRPK